MLCGDRRVAIFDIPQVRLQNDVNGVQVTAWGAHSPQVPSASVPPELYDELCRRHGACPTLHDDYATCLDLRTTLSLREPMCVSARRRADIAVDLIKRERWDLFITVYGETHGAGHVFWHLSQPDHPLYEAFKGQVAGDPLLDVFQEIDAGIGRIADAAGPDATILVFSGHGMGPATVDMPSFMMLPELIYRYSCPGKIGIQMEPSTGPLPPMLTKLKWNYWERHLWGNKYDRNPITRLLRRETPTRIFNLLTPYIDKPEPNEMISPFELTRRGDTVVPWLPPNWYRPAWPKMKAFALPSFADGYVRINVKGRDPQGIVSPDEYHSVCDEICGILMRLRDGRKGLPMVHDIVRTRKDPLDADPKLPDADLIVGWTDDYATDVVESPELGRFGPYPPYRSGSHRHQGFLCAVGPGIAAGTHIEGGHVMDLAPTILQLMSVTPPDYFDGKPLNLQAAQVET
jgi:predicted AlkP superfamily phosphohydrolase/phosphomutase